MEREIEIQKGPGLHRTLFGKKSNVQIYRAMVVGDRGNLALLYYELVTLFLGWIPGALGLATRKIFFKPLFKRVGRNVIFGRNLVLRQPQKVVIGDNVIIDDDCLIDAKGESNTGITIGNYVTIGRFSALVCKNGDIEIGDQVSMGTSVKIVVADQGKVRIGSRIDIGSGSHFSGGSYDYSEPDVLPSSQRLATKGIVVEDLTWIGVGVILLDGVCIGARSIVGAGAVVTKDIPENSIAFGVPAEVKKTRA
jgi:acetyltransferase-like isoleucine patch superfamily enzyme